MAKFNVSAPEAGYSGKTGRVQFSDGRAVIDDETHAAELAYCRAQGYGVEPVEGDEPQEAEQKPAPRRAPAKTKGSDQ